MPSTAPVLTAGRGRVSRPRPLASPGNDRFVGLPHGISNGGSVLFVNSVVSHTRITHLRAIRRPHGLLISREVSGNLHNTVFTLLVVGCVLRVGRDSSFAALAADNLSPATRTDGSARRDVARCRSRTLTDHNHSEAYPGAASRDAASDPGLREPVARAAVFA
jgi:hypothetical protein